MNINQFLALGAAMFLSGCGSSVTLDGSYKWDEKRSVASYKENNLEEREINVLVKSSRGKIITINGSSMTSVQNGNAVIEEINIVRRDGNVFTVKSIVGDHPMDFVWGDITVTEYYDVTDDGMVISLPDDVSKIKDYWIRIK